MLQQTEHLSATQETPNNRSLPGRWFGKRALYALFIAASCIQTQKAQADPDGKVRVAAYNIEWLKEKDPKARFEKLQKIIKETRADIICLAEIENRKAAEKAVGPDYYVFIDDDGTDKQKPAIAIEKNSDVILVDTDGNDIDPKNIDENILDLDEEDFVAPNGQQESFFPNERDVPVVPLRIRDTRIKLHAFAVHAKSRYGGKKTEARRIGHTTEIAKYIREHNILNPIIAGDFNATIWSPSMKEYTKAGFVVATAQLANDDYVSLGLKKNAKTNKIPGREDSDKTFFKRSAHSGPQLFDHIITTPALAGKTEILFTKDTLTSSDHLPVVMTVSKEKSCK